MFSGIREDLSGSRVGGGQGGRSLQTNLSLRHAHLGFPKALVHLGHRKHGAFWIQKAQGVGLFPEEIPTLNVRYILGEFAGVFPEFFNLPSGEFRGPHDGTEFLGGQDFSPALAV